MKLKYEKLLSNFAFNCNLRHYNKVILPWFDNLPWRKALREAAEKVTLEEDERQQLEKATKNYVEMKEGRKKK